MSTAVTLSQQIKLDERSLAKKPILVTKEEAA